MRLPSPMNVMRYHVWVYIVIPGCFVFLLLVIVLSTMLFLPVLQRNEAITLVEEVGGTIVETRGRVWAIVLYDTAISDSDLAVIAEIESLESLNLAFCRSLTDAGLVHLPKLGKLRKLELGGTTISDDGLRAISVIPDLQSLGVSYTKVTDNGLLFLTKLERLSYLNLTGTAITDKGLQSVSEIRSLRRLHISNTKISDTGLKSIERLANLKELNLAGTQITDWGLESLKTTLPELLV